MTSRNDISPASKNAITACLAQTSTYADLHQTLESAIEEFKNTTTYKRLALDYVEHILWMSQRVSRIDRRFSKALNAARGFAEGYAAAVE